jgi:hypothetical protein
MPRSRYGDFEFFPQKKAEKILKTMNFSFKKPILKKKFTKLQKIPQKNTAADNPQS